MQAADFAIHLQADNGAKARLILTRDVSIEGLTDLQKQRLRQLLLNRTNFVMAIKSAEDSKFIGEVLKSESDKLKTLVLTVVSAEGADYLAEGLKNNKCIVNLTLQRYNSSASLIQVFEALETSKSVKQLTLDVKFSSEEEEHLLQMLKNPNIELLNLANPELELTAEKWQSIGTILSTHPSLKELRLNNATNTVCQELEAVLKTNTTLQILHLRPNHFHEESMTHLVNGLKLNSSLKQLLFATVLHDECYRVLVQALANDMIKIEHLDVVQKKGVDTLKALGEAMKTNTKLLMLKVTSESEKSEKFKVLVSALRHNRTLKLLNLSFGSIDEEGMNMLVETLNSNPSLEELDLIGANLENEKCIKVLANGLAHNKTLISLQLHGVNLTSKGCSHLCQALHTNTTLKQISFEDELGLDGMKAIKIMLQKNNTLKTLGISACFSTPEEFSELCDGLKVNRSVNTLGAISAAWGGEPGEEGDEFEEMLLDVLKVNQSLTNIESDGMSPQVEELVKKNRERTSS